MLNQVQVQSTVHKMYSLHSTRQGGKSSLSFWSCASLGFWVGVIVWEWSRLLLHTHTHIVSTQTRHPLWRLSSHHLQNREHKHEIVTSYQATKKMHFKTQWCVSEFEQSHWKLVLLCFFISPSVAGKFPPHFASSIHQCVEISEVRTK